MRIPGSCQKKVSPAHCQEIATSIAHYRAAVFVQAWPLAHWHCRLSLPSKQSSSGSHRRRNVVTRIL